MRCPTHPLTCPHIRLLCVACSFFHFQFFLLGHLQVNPFRDLVFHYPTVMSLPILALAPLLLISPPPKLRFSILLNDFSFPFTEYHLTFSFHVPKDPGTSFLCDILVNRVLKKSPAPSSNLPITNLSLHCPLFLRFLLRR